jgi:hypothetical protein
VSNTPNRNRRPTPRPARRSIAAPWMVLGVGVILAASVALAAAVTSEQQASNDPSAAVTGEINDMGLPVIETPGHTSDQAVAAGVEVSGASWDLGTVPLDTAVRPSWVLRNTSSATVQLGEPHPEIREGCCPGPFSLGQPTLAPGESTTLTFELAMHAGMDGWHDIAVHLPVAAGGDGELLTLGVTGDFR